MNNLKGFAKAIVVAVLGFVISMLQLVVSGTFHLQTFYGLLAGVVGSLLVYFVPNTPPTPAIVPVVFPPSIPGPTP